MGTSFVRSVLEALTHRGTKVKTAATALAILFGANLAMSQTMSQTPPPYPKGSRVFITDVNDRDCQFKYPSVRMNNEAAVGVNGGSELLIRIEPDMNLFKETVVVARAILISPKNVPIDLGNAQTDRQEFVSVNFFGDKSKSYGKTSYFVNIPSKFNRELLDLKTWQLQVTVTTKKNKYTERLRVHFFDRNETVLIYYGDTRCSFTTPAHLDSELYENTDARLEMAVDYSQRLQKEQESQSSRIGGIMDVTWYSSPKSIVSTGSYSAGVICQVVSESERVKRLEKTLEVDLHFTVSPRSYGYVVRQDTVSMTQVQSLTFNSCGSLEGKSSSVSWKREVLPAYTFMSLPNSDINNQEAIKTKLDQYKMFNTCPKELRK